MNTVSYYRPCLNKVKIPYLVENSSSFTFLINLLEVKHAWLGMSRISQIFNSHRTYNSHSIRINSLETSYDAYSTLLTNNVSATLLSIPAEEKIVICASGIYNKETIKYLRRFCYMYNADFSPEWTDSVTHLIVSCEAKSDRLCRKTLKLLQALIAEKWVLSEFWIVQSVNKGKLLPPENFEITNVLNSEVEEDFSHMSTICRNVNKNITYEVAGKVSCRSYRVNRLPPFNDLHFFFCGTFTDISKAAICNLVTTGGGIVHKNINDLLRKKANCQNCFIIASCRNRFILAIALLLSINYTKENKMKLLDGKTIK
ncbi:Breast cancer type 1 susceptibility -like protein [Trichinella nativa]|uniref:Breast cancer type 1 susceptibility-like protein n=1 Tax=Trichinella nativa TaxID=6335 RepID=A0A0V1KP90_9BILA|nr:Breast cancer type 1 susceptibility -like protein [Trichinella nativa]